MTLGSIYIVLTSKGEKHEILTKAKNDVTIEKCPGSAQILDGLTDRDDKRVASQEDST